MKTIQAVGRYFPDKCGGIQVNISELASKLQELGVSINIAAEKKDIQEENT